VAYAVTVTREMTETVAKESFYRQPRPKKDKKNYPIFLQKHNVTITSSSEEII
jgi:hypothetical protein